LPWLGPLAYPPVFLVGLIAPLLTGSRRERDDAAVRAPSAAPVGDAQGQGVR